MVIYLSVHGSDDLLETLCHVDVGNYNYKLHVPVIVFTTEHQGYKYPVHSWLTIMINLSDHIIAAISTPVLEL